MKATMMVKAEPIRIESMSELATKDMPVYVWSGTAYEAYLRVSSWSTIWLFIRESSNRVDVAVVIVAIVVEYWVRLQASDSADLMSVYKLVVKYRGDMPTDNLYDDENMEQVRYVKTLQICVVFRTNFRLCYTKHTHTYTSLLLFIY